jgi:hypothetical protein
MYMRERLCGEDRLRHSGGHPIMDTYLMGLEFLYVPYEEV